MIKKISQTTFFILAISLLISCGSNKKNDQSVANAQGSAQSNTDITRPPVFVSQQKDTTEVDPNETISLEEWKKKQQEKK